MSVEMMRIGLEMVRIGQVRRSCRRATEGWFLLVLPVTIIVGDFFIILSGDEG
jgi:hypothetical protein